MRKKKVKQLWKYFLAHRMELDFTRANWRNFKKWYKEGEHDMLKLQQRIQRESHTKVARVSRSRNVRRMSTLLPRTGLQSD